MAMVKKTYGDMTMGNQKPGKGQSQCDVIATTAQNDYTKKGGK